VIESLLKKHFAAVDEGLRPRGYAYPFVREVSVRDVFE
jgi:hypothetical protein